MLKASNKKQTIINIIIFIAVLSFVSIVYGAIPFYSMPTLGQIVWASGFAESFAHNDLMIYANNFGIPHKAAIAFGLPGAFIQSLFIKYLHFHVSDAYSAMSIILLSIALYGTIKLLLLFGTSLSKFVEDNYSWDIIKKKFLRIIDENF